MKGYQLSQPINIKGDVSKKYWEGLKQGEIYYQTCHDCNQSIFYARVVCPNCLSDNLSWEISGGKGEIYTFTTVYRTAMKGFKEDVPYHVGLIDLDEGVRVLANIIEDHGIPPKIGQRVEADFVTVSEEYSYPIFRIVEEESHVD